MTYQIKNKKGEVIFTYEQEHLNQVDLSGADLREANLYGAKLREADLREANVREVVLNHNQLISFVSAVGVTILSEE